MLAAGNGEGPEDIAARVHYERAVRAEADGRLIEAEAEAQKTLQVASIDSRFHAAATHLLASLRARNSEKQGWQGPDSSIGPHVELIIDSTLLGVYSGALASAAANTNAQGTAAFVMVGAAAGLGISLGASWGRPVPAADAPMLLLGSGFGTFASLVGVLWSDQYQGNAAVPVLGAEVAGALLGVGASHLFSLTSGDASSAQMGAIFGGIFPLLLVETVSGSSDAHMLEATALITSTLGMVGLPLANQTLHWSRTRWNLIGLGAGVGGLFGGGIAVLAKVDSTRGVAGAVTAGVLIGAVATTLFSSGLADEEPQAGQGVALLESRPGAGLQLGSVLGSLSPALAQNRDGTTSHGVAVRAFDARF